MSAALLQAMLEGGPVGVLYGYLVTAVAMTVVAAVISELARYKLSLERILLQLTPAASGLLPVPSITGSQNCRRRDIERYS